MSRHRVLKRMGFDWEEVIDELEAEENAIRERGLEKTPSAKGPDIIQYTE